MAEAWIFTLGYLFYECYLQLSTTPILFARMLGHIGSAHAFVAVMVGITAVFLTIYPKFSPLRGFISIIGMGALHEGTFNAFYITVYSLRSPTNAAIFQADWMRYAAILSTCIILVYMWIKVWRPKIVLPIIMWQAVFLTWIAIGMPITLSLTDVGTALRTQYYYDPTINAFEIIEWAWFLGWMIVGYLGAVRGGKHGTNKM